MFNILFLDQDDIQVSEDITQSKDEKFMQTPSGQVQETVQTQEQVQDIQIDDKVATPLIGIEIGQGDNRNKKEVIKAEENPKREQEIEEVKEPSIKEIDKEIKTPRKRRGSTASNKSKQETKTDDEKPNTRARRQSIQSEEKTPPKTTLDTSENIPETPEVNSPRTSRRSKTPNIERRILTRRASRELTEKDDELMPLEGIF